MWPSRETYARLRVDQYDDTRVPGFADAACAIARRMPGSAVTSPFERKTATSGACSPVPKAFSVR